MESADPLGVVFLVYVACAAFGGVLIVASIVMGAGHNAGGDGADAFGDAGGGHSSDHAHTQAGTGGAGLAVLLSSRFWIFALAFFGLTGMALHGLGGGGARAVAPFAAAALGLGAGYAASRIFGSLARQAVGRVAAASDHVGREGLLLLPVSKQQRGKLRMRIGATEVDLLAETDEDDLLPSGASVLVCAIRGQVAVVARNPAPPPARNLKESS